MLAAAALCCVIRQTGNDQSPNLAMRQCCRHCSIVLILVLCPRICRFASPSCLGHRFVTIGVIQHGVVPQAGTKTRVYLVTPPPDYLHPKKEKI